MTGKFAPAALGAVVFLLFPSLASAATIFSNFGPSFAYDINAGGPVGNLFDSNTYGEGAEFTPATNAIFGSLKIALSCFVGCPTNFTVAITANLAGHPGAAIESFLVAGSTLGGLGFNNPPVALTSILTPTLLGGTQYWVTVTSSASNSGAWNLNSTSGLTPQAISTDGGATWAAPTGSAPGAFDVESAAAQVPEPGTWGMLGAGLALLGLCVPHRNEDGKLTLPRT